MGITSTVASYATGLEPRLAASIGLSATAMSGLLQKALPVMVRNLCKADGLGGPESVWNMCQQHYRAHVHTNLTELTRTDSGWPEHRRHLAQTLLTKGRLIALAEYHAPAAPERASQWLGCLALVTMATAGQHAAENYLDATGLQLWLQKQTATTKGPTDRKRTASLPAPQPVPNTATVPWWSLAVLAVAGICTSNSHRQQTAAPPLAQLPQPATTALAALPTAIPVLLLTGF